MSYRAENIKTLFDLVVIEATNLKTHATRSELERLNLDRLTPHTKSNCIYGQLTGNCIYERAEELIYKCATKGIKPPHSGKCIDTLELVETSPEGRFNLDFLYLSPIEVFLYVANDINKGLLVKFLKNEISELKFE